MPLRGLLTHTIRHDVSTFSDDTSGDVDWLNPIAMSVLSSATQDRRDQVVLNGISYNLRYDERSVHLRRTDGGFVPMGSVSLDRLRGFQFE